MIFGIVYENLHNDCIQGVKKMIGLNHQMSEKFSDKLLATLIISKLPDKCDTMRQILVERETVPTCNEIVQKLVQNAILASSVEVPSHRVSLTAIAPHQVCFNCDSKGKHFTRDCDKPAADCEHCGAGVSHMTKFCFVPNDKPLPPSWKPERKAAMEEKRKAFKEKKAGAASSSHAMLSDPSLTQMRALLEGTDRMSFVAYEANGEIES